MKIKVVEVLTLNQEVARSRNAQIRALYSEDEGLSPEVLREPTQRQGRHPTDPEAARQKFRGFRFEEAAGPREALAQLRTLCHQWLRPEVRSKEQMLELLVLEQFLGALPGQLRVWVESQHPEDCQEAVALVEDVTWISEEEGECSGRVGVGRGSLLWGHHGGWMEKGLRPLHLCQGHLPPPCVPESELQTLPRWHTCHGPKIKGCESGFIPGPLCGNGRSWAPPQNH